MNKEEVIEILSEMRSEYNLFGDEEEATRYHVLSWAIKEMNAEPVKHGHWIDPAAADCYRCSVCEEYTLMEMPRLLYHYCPNCGSKMDVSDTNVGKMNETCD